MGDVNIPAGIAALAERERLGEPRGVHDPGAGASRPRVWLVVFGLPGLILLPFTGYFLVQGLGWASALSLLLTAGYLGAAGRILVRDVLPGYGRVLYRYDNGLVLAIRREAAAFPWDAIRELRVSGVRRGPSDTVNWRLAVTREDGREAVIGPEFPEIQEIVHAASEAVTERVLPKYVSRVEGGGTIQLGPFAISRDGIAKDGETLPWRNVAAVKITNGMVHVDRADRLAGLTATAGEVPNAVAFVELTRRLRDSRDDPGADGTRTRTREP